MEPFTPDAEDLALVEHLARAVARSRRLQPEDVNDFVQSVHARMAERRYDVLRRFEGRSSLRTYLTVVLLRCLKDWQNQQYGKWRPCAAARRLGPTAVALDRLINRDGSTLNEAIGAVSLGMGVPEHAARAMADAIPARIRRRCVPLEAADSASVAFVDPLVEDGRRGTRAARASVVRGALRLLPADDVDLVVRRFVHGTSVQALARSAGIDAKALYRRFDRIRMALRATIEAHGHAGKDWCEWSS